MTDTAPTPEAPAGDDERPTASPDEEGQVHKVDSVLQANESSLLVEKQTTSPPPSIDKWNSIKSLVGVSNELDSSSNDDPDHCTFPQSTHTLLFTEPILSLPFVFAVAIASLSLVCLVLVLVNNMSVGSEGNRLNVPVDVGDGVRGAQYISILVGLLMEEEIPQALILLRAVSKGSFQRSFPQLKFSRFLLSAIGRLIMGYLFLFNLYLVIVQADNVLDIFFDILALQFVQQIDDVAYQLATRDMLGKALTKATLKTYPFAPLDAEKSYKRRTKSRCFKLLYFANMGALLYGVISIHRNQHNGNYLCQTLTITFGENIWEGAHITNETGHPEDRMLVYSYFNGVYKLNGTHDGYPKYTEQNKVDGSQFQITKGAEIRYCQEEESWVFSHEDITKSGDSNESGCAWLLKSEKTSQFDVLEVGKAWSIWTGIIEPAGDTISFTCNECEQSSDCNYHGECINQVCVCHEKNGFFGQHCEHEAPCNIMRDISDEGILTYWDLANAPGESSNPPVISYGRPVYLVRDEDVQPVNLTVNSTQDGILGNVPDDPVYDNALYDYLYNSTDDMNYDYLYNSTGTNYNYLYNYTDFNYDYLYNSTDINYDYLYNSTDDKTYYDDTPIDDFWIEHTWDVALVYSGSRWFASLVLLRDGALVDFTPEYHAFWFRLYEKRTYYVSDPDTRSSPIGVDFYQIAAQGGDFGPFGLLVPVNETKGAGLFHCVD